MPMFLGDVLGPFQFKVDTIDDNMEGTMIILHPAHAAVSHRGEGGRVVGFMV
jgi:hypothetical protein